MFKKVKILKQVKIFTKVKLLKNYKIFVKKKKKVKFLEKSKHFQKKVELYKIKFTFIQNMKDIYKSERHSTRHIYSNDSRA